MKLTSRGVTILAASGDGGSHFSLNEFDPLDELGRELNQASCELGSVPVFPTQSPWVLSAGGTTWEGDDCGPTWDVAIMQSSMTNIDRQFQMQVKFCFDHNTMCVETLWRRIFLDVPNARISKNCCRSLYHN